MSDVATFGCELYCGGNAATQHQVGWWPDTYACDDCRVLWDVLCSSSPKCRALAEWHLIGPQCRRAAADYCGDIVDEHRQSPISTREQDDA